MPKITIIRASEWNSLRKKIDIYIDDKEVGYIGAEEVAQFEVSPGKHTLMLKNLWPARNTSLEVDLSDNQDKMIRVSSSTQSFGAHFIIAFITSMVYSLIKSYFDIELSWYINIIVLVFIILVALLISSKKGKIKLEEE